MFGNHANKRLSAYCNRETRPDESIRIGSHLLACSRCRANYDVINQGVNVAGLLNRVHAPEELWNRIEESLESGVTRGTRARTRPAGPLLGSRRLLVAAIAIVLISGLVALIIVKVTARPAWTAVALAGRPRIGPETVRSNTRLEAGQWIETDSESRARLLPGSIGEVEVEPGSRLELLKSARREYRLALDYGELRARISAPPRIFFVQTPSATAVDLGCAYTLSADRSGAGQIEVTAGMVEFVSNGRSSRIPAEAACLTRPGTGPGTPYFEDAAYALKAALNALDFGDAAPEARDAALEAVLSTARPRDSLTLWHLISRVEGAERDRVYDRLAQLVPPPARVTRQGVMQLDSQMLDAWFAEIEPSWFR